LYEVLLQVLQVLVAVVPPKVWWPAEQWHTRLAVVEGATDCWAPVPQVVWAVQPPLPVPILYEEVLQAVQVLVMASPPKVW